MRCDMRAVCAALVLLAVSSGLSDTNIWQNGSGVFSDPSQWVGGVVPGVADTCLFPDNGSYAVSFTAGATNQGAFFTATDGGEAAFDLNGLEWCLTNGLAVDASALNNHVALDNGRVVIDGSGVTLSCFNDAQPSSLTLGGSTTSVLNRVRVDNASLTFVDGSHFISNELYLTTQYSSGSKLSSMTVSNGTLVLRDKLWCGQGNGSTGAVNLAGGTMIVSNYFSVGDATASAVGIVNITGGDLYTYGPNWLGNAYGGTGILNLEAGSFTCKNRFEVGHRARAKGELTISGGTFTANSDMTVANYESGLCDTTGRVTLAGGQLEVKSTLYLGMLTNCCGTLRMTGCATATLERVCVGHGALGYGEFQLTNGLAVLSSDLEVATLSNSTGRVTVDGGSLSNKNGNVVVGMRGNGRMTMNGGNAYAASSLVVGRYAGSLGAFDMNGGALSCNNFSIGEESGGNGTYVQTSGVIRARSGASFVGNLAGSTGSLTVVDGELHAEQTLYVGNYGKGSMAVSNGFVRLANGLYVGNNASGTGTLFLAGGAFTNRSDAYCGSSGVGNMVIAGGTNYFTGILYVGNSKEGHLSISGGETYVTGSNLKTALGAGSTATVNMNGGYLNVRGGSGTTDGYLDIGGAGRCVFEMTGGLVDAEVLRIGPSGGSAPAVSRLVMNGGRLNVLSVSYLADTAVGTGEVYLVNGVLSVKQLRGWHGHLEVTFDGGTLEARQNDTSTFIENNRTNLMVHVLTARGLVVDSAGYDVGTALPLPDAPSEHGKLTKKGAGKFVVNGVTSFTGPIAVQQGEVELNTGGMVTLEGGVQIDGAGLLDLHNRNQDFTNGVGSVSRIDGTVQLASGRALIIPGTASLGGTGTVERVTVQSGGILARDKAAGASLLTVTNLTMEAGAKVALTGYTDAEFRAGITLLRGSDLTLPPGSQLTFTLNGVTQDHVAVRTVSDGAGAYQVLAYTYLPGTVILAY